MLICNYCGTEMTLNGDCCSRAVLALQSERDTALAEVSRLRTALTRCQRVLRNVDVVLKFMDDCQKNPLPPLNAPRNFHAEWLHEQVRQMLPDIKASVAAALSATAALDAKEPEKPVNAFMQDGLGPKMVAGDHENGQMDFV